MDLIHSGLFVIILFVSKVVRLIDSFNIDIKTAKVFQGTPGTAFGYSAEFINHKPLTGSLNTRLLVGAPKEKVTNRSNSGIHYICDLSSDNSVCTQRSSRPQYSGLAGGSGMAGGTFGEQHELFGLALTVVDSQTAVACGPMWTDLRWWESPNNYLFTVGRCRVLTLPDGDRGWTAYRYKDKYIGTVELDGQSIKQMLYGRAESGFSADGDGKGKVVIGAPGYSVSRGGVAVFDVHTRISSVMESILDPQRDLVLGYDVAVGNFCGPTRFCFAASNRETYGKVHLLEYIESSDIFRPLLWKKGEQEFSSFGSVLCAMDVTGDGWADLLVGAPTHSIYTNDSQSYDEGRVFVFISRGEVLVGQDSFIDGPTLSGSETSFSRFGSAIGNIGDINRDSVDDVGVGAPLEEQGAGVLYIYLGSPDGPKNKYSQRIVGREFNPPLKSFGSHISKPTSDLNKYNYPDFAVGAPESDALVFLMTRLIINAEALLSVTPNPVDKTNDLCPPELSGQESGCLTVSVCLQFSFKDTSEDGSMDSSVNTFDFDVDLDVDTLVTKDASRRVRLYNSTSRSTFTSVRQTVTVTSQGGRCLTYVGILKQDQINRNPFLPVRLTTSFSLSTISFSVIAPMLNQSLPNFVTEEVKFKNKCGADQKCQTDLVLTGRVLYVPANNSAYPFNVVNETTQVELALDLLNKQETAFGVQLEVNITGEIKFWTFTGNTTIICDNSDLSVPLRCRGWAPMAQNDAARIRLKFLADSVPLLPRNRFITFHVSAMPYDPVENPEMNVADNSLVLTSRTAIVADVRVNGSSSPGLLHVVDSDQGDVTLTHKLLVRNRGPSFFPATYLNVTLPARDSTGDILQNVNVTIKQRAGTVMECAQLTTQDSIVGTTTTPGTSTPVLATDDPSGGQVTVSKTTVSSGGHFSTTVDNDFGVGGILPSKRRRRRRDAEEGPAALVDNSKRMAMDCGTYVCHIYQCALTALPAKDSAEVSITVTISRSAIAFPGDIDTLIYTTTTQVAEPSLALFYPWTEPRIRQVGTVIKRLHSGDEINIWYIIGGIIGGLLFLIIFTIVAWKLGFFKRKDKAKLEKLKRQSGFYEGRRSVKRGQQPSTSDSAPAPEAE